MSDKLHPTPKQRGFLEDHILGEASTILTLKVIGQDLRGFSVNIKGTFNLAQYGSGGPTQTKYRHVRANCE